MRAPFVRKRLRGPSLSTVVPPSTSPEWSSELAAIAARIIYKSPLPSGNDLPIYILNSAAFPDSKETSYDKLLPYVLARLPKEDELIGGKGYEVIFFAGGSEERGDSDVKKNRPSITWTIQAYNVLSRAMRKRLSHLYLVHERRWVRVVTEMFSTIVSPKFRRKVTHVSTLSQLALYVPIQDLLIPPSAYYRDRKLEEQIFVPYVTGRRAFKVANPLPAASDGGVRLPRVLRETTAFILDESNITTEGLFRINARAITLEVLKEAYDRGQKFIVWHEGKSVMSFHQWREGYGDVDIQNDEGVDGYGVLTAAGLVKSWYSDLIRPIFPESSYQYLERNFSGTNLEFTVDNMVDLIGPDAEWSPIGSVNRQILRCHLLPMLSTICQYPENRMSPQALAVCFGPSLLCGSDPIRDAKMLGIINKIVEFAVDNWSKGLRERCGLTSADFDQALTFPSSLEDREDPLDKDTLQQDSVQGDHGNQSHGIALIDHHSSTSSEEEEDDMDSGSETPPPVLPPRASFSSSTNNLPQSYPPQDNPPRYSTIMGPSSSQPIQPPPPAARSYQRLPNVVPRKPAPPQSRTPPYDGDSVNGETQPLDLTLERMSLDSGKAFANTISPDAPLATNEAVSIMENTTGPISESTSPQSVVSRAETGLSSSSKVTRKPVPEH